MFIGREEYLEDLETLWRKRTCSIVSCRGRRRIGKSTLIREFARRTADVYIEIEGLPPNSKEEAAKLDDARLNQIQLDNFIDVLATTTGCSRARVTTWYEAFARLDGQIDEAKRTVVLLDEISWMGMHDANFPGRLRTAWETLFHRHEKLILVICGSVSVWIKENILDNTGFTGRFSRDYVLPELPLSVCTQFWGEARNRVAAREILDVLSVTGGVPRYLEEIDPGLSADENIRRMCFLKSGELFKDFDAIFNPRIGGRTQIRCRTRDRHRRGEERAPLAYPARACRRRIHFVRRGQESGDGCGVSGREVSSSRQLHAVLPQIHCRTQGRDRTWRVPLHVAGAPAGMEHHHGASGTPSWGFSSRTSS